MCLKAPQFINNFPNYKRYILCYATCFDNRPIFCNFGIVFASDKAYQLSINTIFMQLFDISNIMSSVMAPAHDAADARMALGHISINVSDLKMKDIDTSDLLILPTRNLVLFPGVNMTVGLGRESSLKLAEFAERERLPIGIVCQKDASIDNPSLKDLNTYGVVADIIKVLELPDGHKTALLRARGKFKVLGRGAGFTLPGALCARIKEVHEAVPRSSDMEFDVTVQNIRELTKRLFRKSAEGGMGNAPFNVDDIEGAVETVNGLASNMPFDTEFKFKMLATPSVRNRAVMLLGRLDMDNQRMDMTREIMERAREGMEQNHRNAFLQQQMETIREELYGDENDDVAEFEKRAAKLHLPAHAQKAFDRELAKLRRYNPQSPDYSVQYTYIDTFLSLPWSRETILNNDFNAAEKQLNHDHYGLEKVKERIIEQVAMMMANPKGKSPIICLVGPPGVGKTSLGESIARAMNREYQRVAMGGLHDEAEIRGHRRTYLGSMPGRIIDAMRRAGTRNPVLLLDEIDKIGNDYKGDPSAALLEVLDPAQNVRFHDNYIDVDFDLSQVLFIATANTLQSVSRPLLDRMEIIELPGYLPEEKIEIAKRHLVPNLIASNKDAKVEAPLEFTDEALTAIIDNYTAESGVRQLDKKLHAVMRKRVLAAMRGKDFQLPVQAAHLQELLGTPPFRRDAVPASVPPGVVTGLAWTAAGGEILLVEVSLAPAKNGGKLTLTGNLGDVMKESATIALQWIQSNAQQLGIEQSKLEVHNLHVHFPEGAIPKDGPSAGITMATAIASALKGISVSPTLAMTGEITLRGQVLPVGGIREKILAARRAGVTNIILCEENRRDVNDIPAAYTAGLTIQYVSTVQQVLDIALQ